MANDIRIKFTRPHHTLTSISVTTVTRVTFNDDLTIASGYIISSYPTEQNPDIFPPYNYNSLKVLTEGFDTISNAYIDGLYFYCDGETDPNRETRLINGEKIVPDFEAGKWKYPEDEEPEAKSSFSFKYIKSVSLS